MKVSVTPPGVRLMIHAKQGGLLFGSVLGKVFKVTDPVPPQVVASILEAMPGGGTIGFAFLQDPGPPLHRPPIMDLFTLVGGDVE